MSDVVSPHRGQGMAYAHSHEAGKWQPLADHLRGVAARAKESATVFSAGNWGYVAGLWHDLGKYSDDFQRYLRSQAPGSTHLQPGRVDHSTAGAQHAQSVFPKLGRILAYAIAGHHAGLPDALGGDSCLDSRLSRTIPDWSSASGDIVSVDAPLKLPMSPAAEKGQRAFQVACFTHMIYSALVDADSLDTEQFLAPGEGAHRDGHPSLSTLAERLDAYLGGIQARARPTLVNRCRQEVLHACREAAKSPPGPFSLTVPTGGGKTLSSLAFALHHAVRHSLRRVIYAIPYTSIIEQNARVFRNAVGDDAVLEHHSMFDSDRADVWARLAAENWDAPLIATTNVQFFESFFASRRSACRKLHNVARSVIVLDEVQTLPIVFLQPCLALLRELVSSYGCTIVLCTATQPAIEYRAEFPIGLKGVKPIIDDPNPMFESLRRVEFERRGLLTDDVLASEIERHSQALCIVNTRRHAHDLYQRLGPAEGNFHLSALMCPAHRTLVLDKIRERLRAGKDCRVVSTQLIEAGVDVDFPVVYRAMAGLDSVAQAAGRCNREGSAARGVTVLFEPEVPVPAGHLRQSAQAAMEVLPEVLDLLAPESIEKYFRLFYWQRKEEWDRLQVMRRLEEGYASLCFPFRSIAEDFQFIRDGMQPVIIAFDDSACREIEALRYAPVPPSGIDRRLQRYVVTVPGRVRDGLPVEVFHERFHVLADPGLYDERTGLRVDRTSQAWDIEKLMV